MELSRPKRIDMATDAVCRRGQVDQLDGGGRNVSYVEVLGLADGTLYGQQVAAAPAVRASKVVHVAAADRHPTEMTQSRDAVRRLGHGCLPMPRPAI